MVKKETKAEKALPNDPFENMGDMNYLEQEEIEAPTRASEPIRNTENDSDEETLNASSLLDVIDRARNHDVAQHPVENQADVGSRADSHVALTDTDKISTNPEKDETTGGNESILQTNKSLQSSEPSTDDPTADALLLQLVDSSETNPDSGTQLDEEDNQMLDELIAIIDGEIEAAYGPGAMADLTSLKPDEAVGEEQFVIFTLADTEYAVSIDSVIEIGRPVMVTPVPNVPDWLLGVSNLRGEIISIVDLRTFFGMGQNGFGQSSRMMIANSSKEDLSSGLIVDRVSGIRYLTVDQIGTPTAPIEDQVTPYLQGVYEYDNRLLVVLDFDRLLLSPEIRQF